MKYTPEQIRPKKYPDEKPKHHSPIWFEDKVYNQWTWYLGNGGDAMFDEYERKMEGAWFIDIPDAPPELKPLPYPENKPSERGKYLCHISDDTVFNMEHDEWEVMKWEWDEYLLENNWNGYRELVDYFIDVNLDVNNDSAYLHSDNEIGIENEMNTRKYAQTNQKENKMEIIWETDELKATLYHDDALIYLKDAYGDIIGCSVDELTAFARHWLDLQGYDVTKRKPEIKACPVCGTEAHSWCEDDEWYYVQCGNITCAIRSDSDISEEHVIKRWNALPRKGDE